MGAGDKNVFADPNIQNSDGRTALHWCVQSGASVRGAATTRNGGRRVDLVGSREGCWEGGGGEGGVNMSGGMEGHGREREQEDL